MPMLINKQDDEALPKSDCIIYAVGITGTNVRIFYKNCSCLVKKCNSLFLFCA